MHNKNAARILCAMSVGILATTVSAAKPNPEPATIIPVRLIAQAERDVGQIFDEVTIYVLLPDGSHAVAVCNHSYMDSSSPPCRVESFAPEKRVVDDCVDAKRTIQVDCFINMEAYNGQRVGNDLIIYGATGGIRYHITGSWGEFSIGKLTPHYDPNWTAVCQDGTYSYSKERSGTCADHGGVDVWHP